MKGLLSVLVTLSVLSLAALGTYVIDNWRPIYGIFALFLLYLVTLTVLSRSSYLFVLYLSKRKEYKAHCDKLGYYEDEEFKNKNEAIFLNFLFYGCFAAILIALSINGIKYSINFFS